MSWDYEARKVTLVAFNGDDMCFMHVLLNALDFHERGHDVAVVIEGAATGLMRRLTDDSSPLHGLYARVKEAGLITAVCRACSQKMGTLEAVIAEGLPLGEDMHGHPSLAPYTEGGHHIITF